MKLSLSSIAVVLVAVAIASPAFAQPATGGGSGSAAPPAGGSDEPIYVCKHATGPVAVNFKPESELKDLIAWAMGFTCKNFILDPRIVSTGKKVTVMAPAKMSPADAYRLFLVALSTMGLTVVPKGNILRIVESATAKSETLPIMKTGVPADDDQMVRYVLRPSYAQTETLRAALTSSEMRARLATMGAAPAPTSPAEFAAFIKSELAKYQRVVKFSGAKVD